MVGFEAFLQQYGWLGFFFYVVVKEAWPFFRDRVWPWKMAAADTEHTRLKNLEERAAQNDERQVKAVESMSLSVHQMALAITTNNERLAQLTSNHAEHARITQDVFVHAKVLNRRLSMKKKKIN